MVSYRQVESRPGRGWCGPRPRAGTTRRRLRRLVAHALLPVLLSLGALLGAGPAMADAGLAGTTPSSGPPATAAPSAVGQRLAGVQPRTAAIIPTPDRVAPVAEIATPEWLSKMARPVMVIGLLIVVASIVSILRDI